MRWIGLIIFKLFLCASANTIILGAEDDWFPYSGIVDGKPTGMALDIVKAAFAEQGLHVHFDSLPYSRCMKETLAGKLLGCFNTARDELIEPLYDWHSTPLFKANIQIWTRTQEPLDQLTLFDLESRLVGVTNGYTYGGVVEKNPRIRKSLANRDEQSMQKLMAGRVDAVLVYEKVAEHLIASHGRAWQSKMKPVGVLHQASLYVSFSKTFKGSEKIRAQFDLGFKKIKDNGQYDKILKSWISPGSAANSGVKK